MKQNGSVSRRRLLPLVGLCLIPGLISGCGGGNTLSGGGPGDIILGTFSREAQVGNFTLRAFENNSVTGTLTVASASNSNVLPAVLLPPGTYNVTGTRTGNSFTATGQFPGTPPAGFTISGTLPTNSTNSVWTVSGSLNGQPYSIEGLLHITGSPNTGNANFSFSNLQNSNANTSSLRNTVSWGQNSPLGTSFFNARFSAGPESGTVRTLIVTLSKPTAIAVGDTFPVSETTSTTPLAAQVFYMEGAPTSKSWGWQSGTVKVTAISGDLVTLQLINVRMQASQFARPGVPNAGTGTFTINGTGSVLAAHDTIG